MRMELLLDQSNKKHKEELAKAREHNKKLWRSLNAVAADHSQSLRGKEDKQTPLERKRKIAEAKAQFKSLQDKRAIGNLVDLCLDVKDMATSLQSLDIHREVFLTGGMNMVRKSRRWGLLTSI